MKKSALPALLACLIFLLPSIAFAEAFDTHHRIHFGLGAHSFFPDDDEHEGTRPNADGQVTDEEFAYVIDDGYDISDFNGLTFEAGYEYLFVRWFGLGTTLGWYGGNKSYDFRIEGIEVNSDLNISVFHIDLLPRFHWQTRWTDLYGGPVLGIYSARVRWNTEVSFMNFSFEDSETDKDSGLGGGLDLGFEFRINERWGLALEDRLTTAPVFNDGKSENEWLNAGGNIILLFAVVHL